MSFISAPHTPNGSSGARRAHRTIAKATGQQGAADIGAVGKKGMNGKGVLAKGVVASR